MLPQMKMAFYNLKTEIKISLLKFSTVLFSVENCISFGKKGRGIFNVLSPLNLKQYEKKNF